MKRLLMLLFVVTQSATVLAMDSYTIDSRHTFPGFEIDHLGFSTQRGRFNSTRGNLKMDPEKGKGSLQVEVDAASISTGLEELEAHLRGEDFFDVQQYPKIVYQSTKLVFEKEKLVEVQGLLTMRGQTHRVDLKVDHFYCGRHFKTLKYVCGANASGALKRSDFGVDKYTPFLADKVKIVIQVEAIKD